MTDTGKQRASAAASSGVDRVAVLERHHHNALYLVVALVMIFMTFVIALQPLYLRDVLGLARDNAGFVNANIQVITELLDLLMVGYLGYLSDRTGRIPLLVYGFLLAGIMAVLAPFDREIGLVLGVSSLLVFYLVRVLMSFGTTMIWPQVATLTGDYSTKENRTRMLANVGFMMAFGVSLVYAVFMQLPHYIGVTMTMWLGAAIAFAGAWLAQKFLVEVAMPRRDQKFPFRRVWTMVRQHKRLRLSFLTAFTSRNDMVVIGLFLMTWFIYFSDLIQGVDHIDAASYAGTVIGLLGGIVLVSVPIWGWLIERIGEVTSLAVALLFTGIGFASLGLIVNPFSNWIFLPVLLIGIGQAGCLLVPQTLALDLAPEEIRGSILGVFNTIGCLGVIFFLQIGGILFDWISPTAPFVLAGIANLLIFGYALLVMRGPDEVQETA